MGHGLHSSRALSALRGRLRTGSSLQSPWAPAKNKRHQRRTLLVLIDSRVPGPRLVLLQSYRHLTRRIVLSSVCMIVACKKGAFVSVRSDHNHPPKVLENCNVGRGEPSMDGLNMVNADYKKLHSLDDMLMQPQRSCIRTVISRPRLQSSMVRESNRDKDVTTEQLYPPRGRGRKVDVNDLLVSGSSE